jgi:hypothetical protein
MRRLLLAAVMLTSCATTYSGAGAPVALQIQGEAPEIIWVTRSLSGMQVTQQDGSPVELKGSALFACYRAPASAPAAPKCYMAEHVWTMHDLMFPIPAVVPATAPVPDRPRGHRRHSEEKPQDGSAQ